MVRSKCTPGAGEASRSGLDADSSLISVDFGELGLMSCVRQPSAYVSPSDDIMSPCTKKLSDIKGKRFKK